MTIVVVRRLHFVFADKNSWPALCARAVIRRNLRSSIIASCIYHRSLTSSIPRVSLPFRPMCIVCRNHSLPPCLPLLLLLMFTARLVYTQPPTVSHPATWRLNQLESRKFVGESIIKPILLREAGNMTYACGFYCEADCDGWSYLFSVLIIRSHVPVSPAVDSYFKPNVVWSANRNNLVTVDAVLELTNEGDLILKDKTAVWSAVASGKHVAGIDMTDVGNLVLFDEDNETVWQSFDYPTDTLLRGQRFKVGKRLVASVSETNWTEQSLFLISLTSRGLFAVAGSECPLLCYARLAHLTNMSYVTMVSGCLFMFLNDSGLGVVRQILDSNPHAVSAQYIRLDYDRHVREYGYDDSGGSVIMGDMLPFKTGDYPLACRPYGICSKGQCSCPLPRDGVTYFNPISSKQPELGCSPTVALTCGDSRNQTFLQLGGVTYFNFIVDLEGIDADGCVDACARNCSCEAAIFRPSLNDSIGKCFLPSELLSLISVDRMSYEQNNHTVYLKVRKPPDHVNDATNRIPGSKGKKSSWQKAKGSGFAVAVAIAFLGVAALLLVWRKMRSDEETEDDRIEEVPGTPARFSYADLKSIMDHFSQKLGEGGFGAVFKGTLRDGTKVAVKRLDGSRHMKKSFLNEVGTIGSIHHINLVKLLGFCTEKSRRLLVYEYMSNGSLDKWIFESSSGSVLDWRKRRGVILDVARGLHYLHEQCQQKIVHLDIKPQNILLDDNLRGKVSDFGLSKLVDRENDQVVTTAVRGTPGYLAPEWLNGMLTEKVDVYSFGIVILEIILGRRAVDTHRDSDDTDLLKLFERKVEEGRLMELIEAYSNDLKLNDCDVVTDALRVMRIACWCLQTDFRNRPSMSTVIKVMDGVMEVKDDDLVYDFAHPIFTRLEFEARGGL